jgi:membrane protein YqaA with SNARE-associated domain
MDYLALFASAFAAATILPFPSEVPLALVVGRTGDVLGPLAVATSGNFLGACTTYALARWALRRVPDGSQWSRAAALIRRFGAPALLLSWVPIVGDALVAVAGGARMPFGRFSLWTAAGKAARYLAVAYAVQVNNAA